MTIERHVKNGRRLAEKLMLTTVAIGTETEGYDPTTGQPTIEIDPVYTGKAKIRQQTVNATDQAAGGQGFSIQSFILSLPFEGTGTVGTDMALKVTSNPLDTALEGAMFRIAGSSGQTVATARRFEIERTS